jgi:glycosyltransferase involved in cell wall biosynthesis
MSRIRFAYLQKAPSPHADACLRALARSRKTELFVTMPGMLEDNPFDPGSFAWLDNPYPLRSFDRDDGLLPALVDFRPDVTLVVGWEVPLYRRCARRLRGTSLRVVCMDNQWRQTPKQLLGIVSSRLYLRPCFDAAFVPGPRAAEFARRLAFPPERVFEGFYSADVDLFGAVAPLGLPDADDRRAFAYVGRLTPQKGAGWVESLTRAYADYRSTIEDPWKLIVVGRGPLERELAGLPGVELRGFVEPEHLPAELARAAFLVLPSTFEQWGVAVHEAAAAGLGCLCSSAAGAVDVFVRDGVNGRVVAPGRAAELADAMRWAHTRSRPELATVSETSRALAARYTPERWARTVLAMAGVVA